MLHSPGTAGMASYLAGVGVVNQPAFLTRVKNGQGSSRILAMGDSRTVGSKASDAGTNVDARKNSWPVRLAAMFSAASVNARADAWIGPYYPTTGSPDADAVGYDPNFSFGSFVVEGRNGFNARLIRDNAGTTPAQYTPAKAFNALEVYFVINTVSTSSAFSVAVDGVTVLASQLVSLTSLGGVERMGKVVITGLTKKVQRIDIARIAGDVRISAVIPYCSDESELLICSAALSGSTSTQFNSTTFGYSPNYSPTYFPRDATIVELVTNDMLGATGAATLTTNLQAIDAAHGAGGKAVIYGISGYVSDASVVEATQDPYHAAIRTHAATTGRKVVDFPRRWGGFATANASGFMAADGVHDTKSGHADKAAAYYNRLMLGV